MTAAEYRAALEALGLSQLAAGRWLGVSKRTAQKFAADGPAPSAARAIQIVLDLPEPWRGLALDARHPSAGDATEGTCL